MKLSTFKKVVKTTDSTRVIGFTKTSISLSVPGFGSRVVPLAAGFAKDIAIAIYLNSGYIYLKNKKKLLRKKYSFN